MGQSMPDEPIEFGNNCPLGFPAGQTPKFLYARHSGMIQCPKVIPPFTTTPPNGRVFKLEQVVGIPCRWEYVGTEWFIQYTFATFPPRTILFLVNFDDGNTYFGDIVIGIPSESTVYHNDIVACDILFGAKDGIAVVSWTPQATQLLEDINMAKSADLFMELFPLEDGNLVYKFCRIAESTNIKILFEP